MPMMSKSDDGRFAAWDLGIYNTNQVLQFSNLHPVFLCSMLSFQN